MLSKCNMHSMDANQIVIRAIIFFVGVFFYATSAVASYSVSGSIYAYASGGGAIIERDANAGGQTSLADVGVSTGTTGSIAEAKYFANLATGLLGTYAYGYSPFANTFTGGAAHASSDVLFTDTISLTIPAGDYASDLYVTLSGFVKGSVGASGIDGTRESSAYEVGTFRIGGGLGGEEFSLPKAATLTYSSDGLRVIPETTFDLSARILLGGQTLSAPRDFSLTVLASLQGSGAALGTYPYGSQSTSMFSDFYNTGGFYALKVPEGVTWTSDSGVFLSQTPIPLPPSFVLFGFGLLTLIRLRKQC